MLLFLDWEKYSVKFYMTKSRELKHFLPTQPPPQRHSTIWPPGCTRGSRSGRRCDVQGCSHPSLLTSPHSLSHPSALTPSKDRDDAVGLYRRAIAADLSNVEAMHNLATLLMNQVSSEQ